MLWRLMEVSNDLVFTNSKVSINMGMYTYKKYEPDPLYSARILSRSIGYKHDQIQKTGLKAPSFPVLVQFVIILL